jgi:SpoVK/Ycf46/Vps4 family AAA+-type ATPase
LLEKHGHSVTLATNGRQSKTKISLQQLLNCLDGVASGEGIITIATANEPTALDPAILPQARPL